MDAKVFRGGIAALVMSIRADMEDTIKGFYDAGKTSRDDLVVVKDAYSDLISDCEHLRVYWGHLLNYFDRTVGRISKDYVVFRLGEGYHTGWGVNE